MNDVAPATLVASVVMPTHGRRESLLRVLKALDRQQLPDGNFEVIVICDGDVDGSANACRSLVPQIGYSLRILTQENQGPAAARNRGVAEARAELIVFLDDDVVPDKDLLAAHYAAHKGDGACVTIGPLLPPTDQRLSIWCDWEERMLCRQYEAMQRGAYEPTWRQFFTGNAAVNRRYILEAGGFDSAFRRAEDIALGLRLHDLGLRFVFLPHARGWHYVQRSLEAWLRVPTAYGAADVRLARAGHPEVLAITMRELSTRRLPMRAAIWLCAGRPVLVRFMRVILFRILQVAERRRFSNLGWATCSMLFCLLHTHSLIYAIGGRVVYRQLRIGCTIAGTMDLR